MGQSSLLNADELIHLALHAMGNDLHDKAIVYLKKLLDADPENGKAHYLLGAIHAEIGMYDLAVDEMSLALDHEPELDTARFQLGLLHVTSGRVEDAEKVWRGLDELGDKNPLYLFKEGMISLVNDDFDQCIDCLQRGISLNELNEDLNVDMRQIVKKAEMLKGFGGDKIVSDEAASSNGKHMLLSLYKDNDTEDDTEDDT